MHPLISQLLAEGPVITDGAWGTQLYARGLPVGELPDIWNLTRPSAVEDVAREYARAGSQVILTNTFGANLIRLAEHAPSWAEQRLQINRRGAQLSRRAAEDKVKVFASIGPTGKLLLDGTTTPEEVADGFAEQAEALAEGGADGIVIESMADLEEAKLAIAGAKATGLPVVASMVYDSGQYRDRTMMGVTPEQAAVVLAEAGADVIGANCGRAAADFAMICRRLRAATGLPLWIKPNAGLPELVNGSPVYRTAPQKFAEHAMTWFEAGASFVGGCCGTSPEFIREIVAMRKTQGWRRYTLEATETGPMPADPVNGR